jgi:uncharacterized protein (TIGR02145 family)
MRIYGRYALYIRNLDAILKQIPMKKSILLIASFAFFLFQIKAQTVTDIENNVYYTVTMGTQIWMTENLKTTRYKDGTWIPLVTYDTAWSNLTTPGYCWYNNDAVNYKTTYGALYNYYAGLTEKLCPNGWYVPTDAEWTILTDYLGGENVAGGKMKSTGTIEAGTGLWQDPNTGATNESGFSALPGGYRFSYGAFTAIGSSGDWWSSSGIYAYSAWSRNLNYYISRVDSNYSDKNNGFSVRCLWDFGTGIDNMNIRNEINIYPNPVIDNLNIDIANTNKTGILTIYDLIGNIVFQKQIDQVKNAIDVCSLKTGIYIIEFFDTQTIVQKKLIKR